VGFRHLPFHVFSLFPVRPWHKHCRGRGGQGNEGRLASFHRNRSKIERMVKTKYLSLPVEEPDTVLLTTTEVEKLSAVTQGPDTGP